MPRHSGKPTFKLMFNLFLGLYDDVRIWWSSWPIKICRRCFTLRALFHCFIQFEVEMLNSKFKITSAARCIYLCLHFIFWKTMTKLNPDFLLILSILNQTEKDIKAATVKRAAPWISNFVYFLHWEFFCLCCCFLLPLNVRSFYLNETISKHFYAHVESGTYFFFWQLFTSSKYFTATGSPRWKQSLLCAPLQESN